MTEIPTKRQRYGDAAFFWTAALLTAIIIAALALAGCDIHNYQPGTIYLTNGDVLECVDLDSYGWGADGYSCQQEKGGPWSSYSIERIDHVVLK